MGWPRPFSFILARSLLPSSTYSKPTLARYVSTANSYSRHPPFLSSASTQRPKAQHIESCSKHDDLKRTVSRQPLYIEADYIRLLLAINEWWFEQVTQGICRFSVQCSTASTTNKHQYALYIQINRSPNALEHNERQIIIKVCNF